MRRVAALVVVLLAWMMLMFAATSSSEIEISQGVTIDLDLNVSPKNEAKARYADAIQKLRVQLKGPLVRFGIPVLSAPASKPEYVYVKLIAPLGRYADRKSAVLAIRKSDIYVVGYSYTNNNQLRARFFRDIPSTEYANIFPAAQSRASIGYEGSYRELQARAGVGIEQDDRRDVALGMAALGGLIDDISKTPQTNFARNEARLLLIAIQMVPEAVRFKYIENLVRDKIPSDVNPDFKVISLENNWGAISKAIASVQYVTQKFKTNLELQNAQGGPWIVTNAEEIRTDMGLLNYVPVSELLNWLIMQLDHNVPAVSAQ